MAAIPTWVISMLDAQFYNPCEKHPIKSYTYFCRDCHGKLFCETCTKTMAEKHEGHKILKVFKASHQTAIRLKDIAAVFDVSDINNYKINSKVILFLHQKRDKSHIISRVNANHRCEVCGYELDLSKACLPGKRFCSIACKVIKVYAKIRKNYSVVDDLDGDGCARSRPVDQAVQSRSFGKRRRRGTPMESFRKRSRKGTPTRSPFF
ncbi:hypothetical protein FH972_004239 [Carpinus fangiana]|uniref:B box-type domain-containing protein n=1 Tax=Carpinus fangiana TaxID=176857 RepID=A0A5N6QL54_9ROSI|nr:hypothetical protein FH972_004239 [Carpinus fangiana]